MKLPAAACSIGVSLKAFPDLESIHPDNIHFRQSVPPYLACAPRFSP
ncbi:hypothetical protein MYA98_12620 [Salmonella sp. WGH-01]|nr:hypothetical protein MYA98_12620 [Salmonella sp. WGH-01]